MIKVFIRGLTLFSLSMVVLVLSNQWCYHQQVTPEYDMVKETLFLSMWNPQMVSPVIVKSEGDLEISAKLLAEWAPIELTWLEGPLVRSKVENGLHLSLVTYENTFYRTLSITAQRKGFPAFQVTQRKMYLFGRWISVQ